MFDEEPIAVVQLEPAPASLDVPPQPPALDAAEQAKAFVARIFAEMDLPDGSAPAALPEQAQTAAEQEDGPIQPPTRPEAVPAHWPAEAGLPLQAQQVLILGLGASGLAMARWCARAGAQVTVADTRSAPPQLAALQAELPQVRFVGGAFTTDLVQGQGLHSVYRSPGLSPQSIAPVVDAARAMGLVVGGELDLFARALQALAAQYAYAPKLLAVTGTNGKTTVTSLTGKLLEHAGLSVAVAGNIGPSLLDTLSAHLQAQSLPQAWVLELSSFQLDDVQAFEPTAAVVLNISQDHLDWHGSLAAYASAKARVFGSQGTMVLNRQDDAVMDMLPAPIKLKGGKFAQRPHTSFGTDRPQQPGQFGLESTNGMTWLVRAHDEVGPQLHLQRLMPADALRIRGRHNACNALAALALAQAAGCALAPLLYALREYRGEPHRVQSLGMVGGVEYIDDSKGTNVGATQAALEGLGPERRLVVIAGGLGKGQDFSPLAQPLAQYARAVVLIGQDAPLLRKALADTGLPLLDAADMPQAVALASAQAHSGDAVLLSPACASMDMFDSYEHRAQVFAAAVQSLADEAGQVLQ